MSTDAPDTHAEPGATGDEPTLPHEPTPADELAQAESERMALTRNLIEWVLVLVFAVVIALVVRNFLFQSFFIESGSMESTLEIDEKVVVNRLSYQWGDPEPGQIVVFRQDGTTQVGATRDLIKRVMATGGQEIEGRDGVVYVDGEPLDESYVDDGVTTANFGPTVVPDDHVFVMGDNRNNSRDSRFFGPIHVDNITGRAFVRYWPLDRLGSP